MEQPKKKLKSNAGLWSILLLVGAKLAKLGKLLKFAFPLVTTMSMTISAAAYSFVMGPWLAVTFVLMIYIHEMGHAWAFRHRGLEASMPVFIPFLGGAIRAKGFGSRDDEAFTGIMGPVAGGVGALIVYILWLLLKPGHEVSVLLLTTASTAAWLNLFNLVPVKPLDGGRVMQAVGDWILIIGASLLVVAGIMLKDWFLIFIVGIGLSEMQMFSRRVRSGINAILFAVIAYITATDNTASGFWWWLVNFFVAVAGLISLYSVYGAISPKSLPAESEPVKDIVERKKLSAGRRVFWCASYIILFIGLLYLLYLIKVDLQPLLPK